MKGRQFHHDLRLGFDTTITIGLQTSSGVVTFAMTSSRSILLIIFFLVSLHQFLTYIIYFLLIFYYCNQVTTVSDTLFISC